MVHPMTHTELMPILPLELARALVAHTGHALEIVEYGQGVDGLADGHGSVTIDCQTCHVALADTDPLRVLSCWGCGRAHDALPPGPQGYDIEAGEGLCPDCDDRFRAQDDRRAAREYDEASASWARDRGCR